MFCFWKMYKLSKLLDFYYVYLCLLKILKYCSCLFKLNELICEYIDKQLMNMFVNNYNKYNYKIIKIYIIRVLNEFFIEFVHKQSNRVCS